MIYLLTPKATLPRGRLPMASKTNVGNDGSGRPPHREPHYRGRTFLVSATLSVECKGRRRSLAISVVWPAVSLG